MTGPELKAIRIELGLSIARAARQVEVNERSWKRWESGEHEIPEGIIRLFKIVNGLDREYVPRSR